MRAAFYAPAVVCMADKPLSADDAVRAASKSPQLFSTRLKITPRYTLIKIHAVAFSLQNMFSLGPDLCSHILRSRIFCKLSPLKRPLHNTRNAHIYTRTVHINVI